MGVRRFSHRNGLVISVSMVVTTTAWGADLELISVVRDFAKSHADFNVSGGTGHMVDNLGGVLGADGRPKYLGGGYKVGTQWTNATGDPIAPHLFSTGGSLVIPVANPSNEPGGIYDSWNSQVGPYGGANVGPAPSTVTGGEMPEIVVPGFLEELPNQGPLVFSGSNVLYDHIHCDTLDLGGTIEIDGDVRILCEGLLTMATHTEIFLRPGATLSVYLLAGSSSWNHTDINVNTGDPHLCKFYNFSNVPILVHNHAAVYAQIISPYAALELTNHGAIFGTYAGLMLDADNQSDFHLDTAPQKDNCDVYIVDVAGAAAGNSNGAVTSAATFAQWYRDLLGTNISTQYPIPLTDNGSGIYEFHSDAFYPIDGQLFGNEGDLHNNYFTLALEYYFTYEACTGQFFEFAGSDDAWMFVEDLMAIDLGGLQPGTNQIAELERLDLLDGETYKLSFFYAHRKAGAPSFHLRTNIEPIGTFVPGFTASAPRD